MTKGKSNTVKIDFDVFCTQKEYASLTGEKLGTVSAKVARIKAKATGGGGLTLLDIPQLGITLVKRPKNN